MLQPQEIQDIITEDEFNEVIRQLGESTLDEKEIEVFMERSLPIIYSTDKYGLALVHFLCEKIHKLNNK